MYAKHRVQNFWKYFMGVHTEIETAFKEADKQAIKDLRKEVNLQCASVGGAKVIIDLNEDGFFELSFDGGNNKTKQYICSLLKKDAPKELVDDWIINPFVQPLNDTIFGTILKIDEVEYKGSDFKVYYTIDDINKCLHVKVYSEKLRGLPELRQDEIVNYMLSMYVGELEMEARIADVEVIDSPSDDENVCLLPNFFEDICDVIIDQEWIEYQDPTNIYMAYKLDKETASDTLRKDMKLIITTNPLLQEELLNKELDSCNEARDYGAEYGYLFYEIEQTGEQIALVRQQLEKEIQELLYPLSIARCIGGAIGTHYAYIDVIIFDVNAFQLVLEKVNEHLNFPVYYRNFFAN